MRVQHAEPLGELRATILVRLQYSEKTLLPRALQSQCVVGDVYVIHSNSPLPSSARSPPQ